MKRKLFFTLLLLGFMQSFFAQSSNQNHAATDTLRIATFDVNATPPVGSQLTYDPMVNSDDLSLRAKGVVLLGSDLPIVLCAIDWIGISNESQDAFKEALAEAAGTIPNRVVVHTLHQHDVPISDFTAEKILKENNLPVGPFDGTFARELIKDLQKFVRLSLENTQPVTDIGLGSAEVYKVASNRRIYKKDGRIVTMRGSSTKDSLLRSMTEGLVDPEVSLISFWNNEAPLAVLSFYATHPQSYYLTKVANPDFPGIARFYRQLAVPDALHVHFNGAGGNIAAGKYNDGSHETRLILAERMADGMKRAWENTKKVKVSSPDVNWVTEPLFLPVNPKVEEIETTMFKMNSRQLANNMGRLGWYKRRLAGKAIETAALSIGNSRILFMPGELFVEYQLAAKEMAPDKFVTMAAYGDYGPFYIGTEASYAEGGYEVESSPVTKESEKIILDNIKTLLKKAEDNQSDNLLSYRDKNGKYKTIQTTKEWDSKKKDILNNMQDVMGKLPADKYKKFDVKYTDSVKHDNYVLYSINFEVAPSEKVYAYLYKPTDTHKKHPAMLALHGTGAAGKRIINDETSIKNRQYAKELAERGYVVIAPDYPSMGELANYDFENDRYESGTMKAIFNHLSSVDLLQTLDYVNKDKIGVIGHSLGGHNAIFVAAFDPRLKVVVSSCGWTLLDYYNAGAKTTELYGGLLGPWAQDRYMPYIKTKYNLDASQVPFDFDEIIATIAPRAFFTNAPTGDSNFSIDGVRKGINHLQKVYDFMKASENIKAVYPDAGHDFPSDTREEAYIFIDKYLK
ncbi:MAG: alpha/beta fold hydrolase [Dysgonamonadaceae bacterium]|nr:alpha/beta fold hydrolase [Dysgonamonadaceae bacterium]MDD4729581.1 alpha/beta fold hydrolase [Dysgonamonadaceae bacterium]